MVMMFTMMVMMIDRSIKARDESIAAGQHTNSNTHAKQRTMTPWQQPSAADGLLACWERNNLDTSPSLSRQNRLCKVGHCCNKQAAQARRAVANGDWTMAANDSGRRSYGTVQGNPRQLKVTSAQYCGSEAWESCNHQLTAPSLPRGSLMPANAQDRDISQDSKRSQREPRPKDRTAVRICRQSGWQLQHKEAS